MADSAVASAFAEILDGTEAWNLESQTLEL